MSPRAQVTSVEAIEAFRSNLIVFLSKARPAVEEVSSEVMRTRLWVQEDQRRFWENQLRLRSRKLERAQAELSSARMSLIPTGTSTQQMDVRRALGAVREAEDKLSMLKKWNREMENHTAPLLKQVEQLHGFLCSDLTKAVAYLAQVVKTLEAYANVASGGAGTPADAAPAGEEPPADGNAASHEPERRTPIRQVPLAGNPADSEIGAPAVRSVSQRQHADSEIDAPIRSEQIRKKQDTSPETGTGSAPEGGAA
jgi:hypothetical protein